MTHAQLALEAMRLKEVHRAGWVRLGVTGVESVAAHSWGVAFLAVLLCPAHLDRERVLLLAILHDLAEVEVGDLTPHDGVPRLEKHRRERVAMNRLLAGRPDLLAIWEEGEARESAEARFVKRLDELDLGLQARRYTEAGFDVSELLQAAEGALADLDRAG